MFLPTMATFLGQTGHSSGLWAIHHDVVQVQPGTPLGRRSLVLLPWKPMGKHGKLTYEVVIMGIFRIQLE